MSETSVIDAVREIVAEAVALDIDEVGADATLFDEVGAESIDLLDILFRIERRLGVKITTTELSERIQGGIPDEQFGTEDGLVSDIGLEQLEKVMPQIDRAELSGNLAAEDVMNLFTVRNLANMVEQHVGATA
ncbi:acyl carrier protein [Nocardia bovistercoris]|uniref:Acyl carrier protein n=1 Tax=Nocardia bovistercoris TaxID=2785916 RepID=A0A931I8S9_9NOCA|nr:acyl carrier protein [Nocardia bovistercoris]MBH0775473.1 acyl carrier protein [Nocardia bovistercoris]